MRLLARTFTILVGLFLAAVFWYPLLVVAGIFAVLVVLMWVWVYAWGEE